MKRPDAGVVWPSFTLAVEEKHPGPLLQSPLQMSQKAKLLSYFPSSSPATPTPSSVHPPQGRAHPLLADSPSKEAPSPTCSLGGALELSVCGPEHHNPTPASPTARPTSTKCTLLFQGSSPNPDGILALQGPSPPTAGRHFSALSPHQRCHG